MQDLVIRYRRLPLQGTDNTRDLGGYPCDNGATKWGVYLRSDCPHSLTSADLAMLRQYGITTALDLRSEVERNANPSVLTEKNGFKSHHVSLSDQLLTADYEGDTPGSMAGLYISLLDNSMAELAKAMRVLATADGGVLFHCAVGKDRTGVVAMLLLSLTGVSVPDIVADYSMTDIYMREIFDEHMRQLSKNKQARQNGEFPEYRFRSLPKSMWRVLGHLYDVHGGPESYLLSAGMFLDEINLLSRKFVTFR